MKAKQFGQFIDAFSEMLDRADAAAQANAWRTVASMFRAKPSASVNDVCKAITQLGQSVSHGSGDTKALIEIWPSMKQHFSTCAKKPFIDDLKTLIESLTPFSEASLIELSEKVCAKLSPSVVTQQPNVSIDIVPTYLQRLEATLGDEKAFSEVYSSLKGDSRVKAADAKKLAREFTKRAASSKIDALERIWDRHASLMGAGARAKATGGRTAA